MTKKTKRLLKIASEFSIFKTLRFNLKYFDFKTALKCPVWVSRHVRFRSLKGNVIVDNASTGAVRLGFDTVGIFDNKRDRSIIEISSDATLHFQGKANLGNGFKISLGAGALLTIGQRFMLTANTQIVSFKEIEFT